MRNSFRAFPVSDKQPNKTEVFEVQNITLVEDDSEQESGNVIDFGGDEGYHYAYQLTFRKDCIPIVVVNMKEYEMLTVRFGRREATRAVAFDWLAHMITAAHRIQTPILVFTHRDKYSSAAKFQNLVQGFNKSINELSEELLTDIPDVQSKIGNGELFDWNAIFIVGFDCAEKELIKLKNHLLNCIRRSTCSIPQLWKRIIDNISQKTLPHDERSSFQKRCELSISNPEPQLSAVLGFMQRAGQILWYPKTGEWKDTGDDWIRRESMDDETDHYDQQDFDAELLPWVNVYPDVDHAYDDEVHGDEYEDGGDDNKNDKNRDVNDDLLDDAIFHNIDVVKNLIGSLYNHTMTNSMLLQKSSADTETVDCINNSYLCNGILHDKDLRKCIAGKLEKQFSTFVALLIRFKLLHGPTVVNGRDSCYLLPYFMPEHNFKPPMDEVLLQASLNFVGLKVPNYAFHQMSVVFLKFITFKRSYQVFPYGNGVSAKLNVPNDSLQTLFDAHLIHDTESQNVCIKVVGAATIIHRLWQTFCKLILVISQEVKSAWAATRIVYDIPCPHCLIIDRPNPALLDPREIIDMSIFSNEKRAQSDQRLFQRCVETPAIPNALTSKCRSIIIIMHIFVNLENLMLYFLSMEGEHLEVDLAKLSMVIVNHILFYLEPSAIQIKPLQPLQPT